MSDNMFHGFVDGVRVDIFRALPTNEVQPSDMQWVAPPTEVAGMNVGSIPDLMAAKLDVIRLRPKLRDYLDLAAMDQSGACSLEAGLGYYCRRFGYSYPPRVLEEITRLLDRPGKLPTDPDYEDRRAGALGHLQGRVPELRDRIAEMRDITVSDSVADSAQRAREAGSGAGGAQKPVGVASEFKVPASGGVGHHLKGISRPNAPAVLRSENGSRPGVRVAARIAFGRVAWALPQRGRGSAVTRCCVAVGVGRGDACLVLGGCEAQRRAETDQVGVEVWIGCCEAGLVLEASNRAVEIRDGTAQHLAEFATPDGAVVVGHGNEDHAFAAVETFPQRRVTPCGASRRLWPAVPA